jgi:hypothetical protein
MGVWRLVLERIATLREVEEYWSILDVAEANDALDAWIEAHNSSGPRGPGGRT